MKKTIRTTDELLSAGLITEDEVAAVNETQKGFATSITPQVLEAMNLSDPHDPVFRQYVPHEKELNIIEAELDDPIGDYVHTAVKGIVHRYPDRCLLKVVNVCPVYCRFCFRKEIIGPGSEFLSKTELEDALNYIRETPQIWEVILTGGDPLVLNPKKVASVIRELEAIEHVQVIRIHTRIPVVKAENVNDELIDALKISKPVYIVVHANHANEFIPAAVEACKKLVDNGIPLLSQSVLLKGINDTPEALSELMKTLAINRIKPYYLHHGDYAKGTTHFRTTIKKGQELMHYLRANHSGLCQPTYVLDIPGGRGKVPIDYNYLEDCSEGGEQEIWKVEDHKGRTMDYPLELKAVAEN